MSSSILLKRYTKTLMKANSRGILSSRRIHKPDMESWDLEFPLSMDAIGGYGGINELTSVGGMIPSSPLATVALGKS